MEKVITTSFLVLALVGYIGLSSALAATSNTMGPAGQGFTFVGEIINDNYNAQLPGSSNLFGVDEADNNAGVSSDRDRDMSTARGFEFGSGERWSPYNGYHHSDL